jgi:hypothetical protein
MRTLATLLACLLITSAVHAQTYPGPAPTVPTMPPGDNSTHVANTAFVNTAIAAIAPPTATVLNRYIAGYTLANDGTNPTTTLGIGDGQAADSTNAAYITRATAMTKLIKTQGGTTCVATWVAGTGNCGMIAAVANDTWYHVFAILNGGNADVYFDTSITAANKPAGTTAFRRIGSILTDGSGNIIPFIQKGDEFYWNPPLVALNASAAAAATTIPVVLKVPLGLSVRSITTVESVSTSNSIAYLVWYPGVTTSIGPGLTTNLNVSSDATVDLAIGNGWNYIWTDITQHINFRSNQAVSVYMFTIGWIDPLGRF